MSNVLKNHQETRRALNALALISLAGVAVTACGDRVHAAAAKIRACQNADQSEKQLYWQGSNRPIVSLKDMEATATADVLTLARRVRANHGSVDLAQHRNIELLANATSLTLAFPSAPDPTHATDNIIFKIKNGQTAMDAGAIVCSEGNDLYPNNVFMSLEAYTAETASLDS